MNKINIIEGKAFYCGDLVNTDVMSPGRFEPYESNELLASIALIDYESEIPFVDPATKRSPFTIIFAGHEFGCGSSRDSAPSALAYAGAKIVIARSFARIFYRNCINMGVLLPVTYDHSFDESVIGKNVEVNVLDRTFTVDGEIYSYSDFGPIKDIVEAGGLTPFNKLSTGM
ncbi:MAG: hypothetical protein COB30_010230 [Ectothiorhodospiraceae bacterium]|nr:hypothetical protein [Ectothiorhodospiraceae bacterium]